MNNNPLTQGVLTENFSEIGPVTRTMLRARAVELAAINGRSALEVSKSDWEQANRELVGESDTDAQEALLEAIPEAERWDPVPGSTGRQVPASASEDEDDEGRSESEQLFDGGVAEAEHDQTLQASRAVEQKERREA